MSDSSPAASPALFQPHLRVGLKAMAAEVMMALQVDVHILPNSVAPS